MKNEQQMTVVVAWVRMDGYELTGRYTDRLQQHAEGRAVPQAHAAMWLNKGTKVDVVKAEDYIKTLDDVLVSRVYTYPTSKKDPLEAARKAILQEKKS